MTNVLRHLVTFLVMLVMAMAMGESCSTLKIHESGHASYSNYACVIHSNISPTEFDKMADWCRELRK